MGPYTYVWLLSIHTTGLKVRVPPGHLKGDLHEQSDPETRVAGVKIYFPRGVNRRDCVYT
jgi:hypothetical protein